MTSQKMFRISLLAPRVFIRAFSEINTISKESIDRLVKNAKVVVFMKGTPDAPQCGFSNAVVQIMRMHEVEYESHNVLADDSLRHGEYILIVFLLQATA